MVMYFIIKILIKKNSHTSGIGCARAEKAYTVPLGSKKFSDVLVV